MEKESGTPRRRGRPPAFDRDKALDTAVRLFWSRGFEATSIADLGEAMGINSPSLYAAFGDKKSLFAAALERYRAGHGDIIGESFAAAPTARAAIAGLLARASEAYTDPRRPPGCMVIHAAQNCAPAATDVAMAVAAIRRSMEQGIRDRIAQGIRDGELPAGTSADELAGFVAALLQGMSTKARDGASPSELAAIADRGMKAWPA